MSKLFTLLATGAVSKRRIILHCDINRTLIQIDPAGGKTLSDVLNANIADRVFGIHDPVEKKWVALRDASPQTYDEDLTAVDKSSDRVTYAQYVDNILHPKPAEMASLPPSEASALWAKVSALRRSAKQAFTEPGKPGERFRGDWERLDAAMKSPDGKPWFIIPSFFELVNDLSTLEWPFSVVFRTFGHDLCDVMNEWCQFVSGEHPYFTPRGPILERAKLSLASARASSPAESLPVSWIPRGNIYRNASGTYLVYGDDGLPPKAHEDGVAYYTNRGLTPRLVSDAELAQHIVEACDANGASELSAFGLVDYYPWWAAHGEHRSAGKMFSVLTGNLPNGAPAPFQVFFDDNIRFDDSRSIVDFRAPNSDAAADLERAYLISVDPWNAILDRGFFINHVADSLPRQQQLTP